MRALIVDRPHPACILNLADPARAYVSSTHTDVQRTWREHEIIHNDKEQTHEHDAGTSSSLD